MDPNFHDVQQNIEVFKGRHDQDYAENDVWNSGWVLIEYQISN